MSEHDEQVALFNFLGYMEGKHPELKWIHAIPNGGMRHKATAGKMKAEGAKDGVWDIFVPIVKEPCPGMYIEMKFGKNRLTENQDEFCKFAMNQGYIVVVCYDWIEAATAIFWYLRLEKPEELK